VELSISDTLTETQVVLRKGQMSVDGLNDEQEPAPSPETPDKKKMSLKNKLLLGGAGVALAAFAATGIGIGVSSANGKKAPEATSSSAPANAGQETGKPTDAEVQATPISAEKYTTPEAVAKAFIGEVDEWINAGGTEANAKAWLDAESSGSYMDNLMAKSNAQFESQLLVDNWQDIPSLAAYVPNKENIHQITTNLAFFTMPNNPNSDYNAQNKEAYKRGEIVDSIQIVSEDSTKIVANVTVHEYDNSDKNAALQLTKGVAIDTTSYTIRMTMTNVNGNWKLSDYSE
jgi:hypothetical protein